MLNKELPGLRRVREQRELSIRQLAKLSGVGYATISRVENGRTARPGTARKLAATLHVGIDELLSEEARGAPLAPLGSPDRTMEEQVELLETRLLEYERRGERSDVRWLRLHGIALFLIDRVTQREMRKRLKDVARRAFDGYMDLLGAEPDVELIEELLADDKKEAIGAA